MERGFEREFSRGQLRDRLRAQRGIRGKASDARMGFRIISSHRRHRLVSVGLMAHAWPSPAHVRFRVAFRLPLVS